MNFTIREEQPTSQQELVCRERLRKLVAPIAQQFGLEMEAVTAWQDDMVETVQVMFLRVSNEGGPWCIGAIVRRNNGELRFWPREDESGPIAGSSHIESDELEMTILNMVDQYTEA